MLGVVLIVHITFIVIGLKFVVYPIIDRATTDLSIVVEQVLNNESKSQRDVFLVENQGSLNLESRSILLFNQELEKKLSQRLSSGVQIYSAEIKDEDVYAIKLENKYIAFSKSRMAANPILTLVFSLLASFSLTSLFSLLLLRKLTNSLDDLSDMTKEIANNNYTVKAKNNGPYEFNVVSKTIENLASRVKTYIEDRTRVLAEISHDLKTPLSRINFSIECIEDQKIVEDIRSDLEEMTKLIDSSVELGKKKIVNDLDLIDINTLLKDITSRQTNVSFKPAVESIKINIVESDLRRVIGNLINNSIKYGEGKTKVLVSVENESILISVSDNGLGPDKDSFNRLISEFEQSDDTSDGHGLGLSIVYKICKKNNWSINPKWGDNLGFSITIKIKKA
jgi:two-component system, OmpR family, osmolarity sensor histidine kinase EnvZ